MPFHHPAALPSPRTPGPVIAKAAGRPDEARRHGLPKLRRGDQCSENQARPLDLTLDLKRGYRVAKRIQFSFFFMGNRKTDNRKTDNP